jgi:hypothetical protein
MSFYQQRKEVLREKLREVLTMTNQQATESPDEWTGYEEDIEVDEGTSRSVS